MTYSPEIENCVIFFENEYGQRVALPVNIGGLLVRDDDQDDCSVQQGPANATLQGGAVHFGGAALHQQHHHHHYAKEADFIAAANKVSRSNSSVTGALVSILPAVIVAIVTFGIVVLGQWSVPSVVTGTKDAVAAQPTNAANLPTAPPPSATTTGTDRRAQK